MRVFIGVFIRFKGRWQMWPYVLLAVEVFPHYLEATVMLMSCITVFRFLEQCKFELQISGRVGLFVVKFQRDVLCFFFMSKVQAKGGYHLSCSLPMSGIFSNVLPPKPRLYLPSLRCQLQHLLSVSRASWPAWPLRLKVSGLSADPRAHQHS